ncbi:MAG: FAD-binding oxidoreductase [Candidatus Bathyarchaeia archaeon]
MKRHDLILKKLIRICGEGFVFDDRDTLLPYSYDVGNLSTPDDPEGFPEFVVMPRSANQIQRIVRLANKEKEPVVPFISGANMGGLTIPSKGGILVDQRLMKGLWIDEENLYAVVEPGVTFGMLERELRRRNLHFPCPMASPSSASVVGNVLLAGMGHLETKYGCQGGLLNSIEAVLPTGEIIRAGSCAISNHWFSRFPLADLTGLFVGWHGTTGIVTKMAIPLYKRPEFKDVLNMGFESFGDAAKFVAEWSRLELAHSVEGVTWALAQAPSQRWPLPPKPPGDPAFYLFSLIFGHSQEELDYKKRVHDRLMSDLLAKGEISDARYIEMPKEAKEARTNVPNPWVFRYADHRGGGAVAWVGSFVPPSAWERGLSGSSELMEEHGFAPAVSLRSMDSGHYAALRAIIPYNRADKGERRKVRELMEGLVELTLDLGGLIYKAHPWVAKVMLSRAHPGYMKLLKRIKRLLDPNRIMNPGKYGL